uniref:Uncharacterized protein n=1 Tax=Anguilla anguilla TaxID=7936 RepID=A0A0E9QCW4_ANGAN
MTALWSSEEVAGLPLFYCRSKILAAEMGHRICLL